MLAPTKVDAALGAIFLFLLAKLATRKRNRGRLPPGPRGLPLIGNLLDVPSKNVWFTFVALGKKYGDISSFTILGQRFININSAEVAQDLTERRGTQYATRMRFIMGGELCGWDKTLVVSPYGGRWRTYRKYFHQEIGTRLSFDEFTPFVAYGTLQMVHAILDNPDNLEYHVRRAAAATSLRISHGYDVAEQGRDPLVELADKALSQLSEATATGAYLVDVMPILRYIPSWVPGAGFQKTAKFYARTLNNVVDRAHYFTKGQMAAESAPKSFTKRVLESSDGTHEEEELVKWAAASIYLGGSDTTVSANYAFFLAMTLYPEVQKKAQAELDTVVGTDRLPTLSDRGSLPYLEAVVSEVLRWNVVGPLTVRTVDKDEFYGDYHFPAGSNVIFNIWSYLHDERVYHKPMEFIPERFIGANPETDPRHACFGFGRRICPGQQLAEASVWLTCALSLAALKISKALDENGLEITPKFETVGGSITHPAPFKCAITPRTESVRPLVQKNVELLRP